MFPIWTKLYINNSCGNAPDKKPQTIVAENYKLTINSLTHAFVNTKVIEASVVACKLACFEKLLF